MLDLLREIQSSLDRINPVDFAEIEEEAGDEEHIVGEMDEDHRKLYTLRQMMHRELMSLAENAEELKKSEEHTAAFEAIIREGHDIAVLSKFIDDLFWASLKRTYGLSDKPTVVIRKGWKVGWTTETEPRVYHFTAVVS